MNWSGCELVETVPGKVSGIPLIRNTRVPADQVIESLDGGESVENVAFNFDLEPSQVRALKLFRDQHQLARAS